MTSISAGVRKGRSSFGRSSRRIGLPPFIISSTHCSCRWSAAALSITGPMNGGGSAMRIVDDQPVDQLGDLVDQFLFLAVLDDQPPRRGAALAGGQIGRLDDDRRGGLACPWRPTPRSDCCRQAPAPESCCGVSANWLVERDAGARRAGEQQAVDAGLAGQRTCPGRARRSAGAATPSGTPAAWKQSTSIAPRRRGLLRRLEDDGIAGNQRRDDVAVGQMRREIIGPEHRQHAVRLVADRDLAAERAPPASASACAPI